MTSASARVNRTVLVESDVRVVGKNNRFERWVLSGLMVALYVSYGALGRDVFYNHLNFVQGSNFDDPIGANLPYVNVALCLLTISFVVLQTDLKWALSKIPWALAPFLFLAFLSYRWSDNEKDVLRNAIMTITMWMALPMLIHRLGLASSTRVTLHVIALVNIASLFVALAFPLIGRHSGHEVVQSSHVGEWRGIFAHKNSLGPWAAWGSVFLFTHSWICSGPRLYWWLARVAAVVCLLFCHSATSLVACLLLWTFWMGFMLLRRLSLSAFIAAIIFPIAAISVLASNFASDLFAILGRDESFTGRTLIWVIDGIFFRESPWFGHGFQTMGGVAFNDRIVAVFGQHLSPENAYWTMLLDVGVVGFVLFMGPLCMAVKNGFEWIKHVDLVDRACIEMQILMIFSVLVIGITEGQILLSNGFDGVVTFMAFFSLLTVPRSPAGVLRGEFRLAKHRVDPFVVRRRQALKPN